MAPRLHYLEFYFHNFFFCICLWKPQIFNGRLCTPPPVLMAWPLKKYNFICGFPYNTHKILCTKLQENFHKWDKLLLQNRKTYCVPKYMFSGLENPNPRSNFKFKHSDQLASTFQALAGGQLTLLYEIRHVLYHF